MAPVSANWNYPTAIRFGAGRVAELADACRALGIARPLLVTDRGLATQPIVTSALERLRDAGLGAELCAAARPNPVAVNLDAGLEAFRAGRHDGVVAFGGGSGLDLGKLIAFMAGQTRPVWDFEDIGDWWTRADSTGIRPIIAVPTTAGTGSEVGRAAVLTDTSTQTKKVIFHPRMMPGVVICDPELTTGMPRIVTAGTGMDALAHCLEAYCAPGYHPFAEGIAVEGMRLVFANLPRVLADGTDLDARGHMMSAAAMGATAFQKGLGAIHALSHPVGALYDTHHGMTNAVLMPYVLAFNRQAIVAKIERLAAWLGIRGGFDGFLDAVLELRKVASVPNTLAGLGIDATHAARIAAMAVVDPTAGGNPVPLAQDAAQRLFMDASRAGWRGDAGGSQYRGVLAMFENKGPDNKASYTAHTWRFFRSGGFSIQVSIETADDLRHLGELDQKLWTALNCPTSGLEFDARTLDLLDRDRDSQIRVPEILAAVEWTCGMLRDPQVLFEGGELALDEIDDSHPDGATLKAAATQVLLYLGKTDAGRVAVDDFADPTRLFAPDHPNGDGVVPAELACDDALADVIGEIVTHEGAAADRSGEPGITAESLEAFFEHVDAVRAWRARGAADAAMLMPLGADTEAAADALSAVETKVNDYFTRCRLAAFDVRAAEPLNPPATMYAALAERAIAPEDGDVAALPLAEVAAGRSLPLGAGLNPAWTAAIAQFRERTLVPLIGQRDVLTPADWATVSSRLAAHRAWRAEQPETGVNMLDPHHLERIARDGTRSGLAALIERDLAADGSAANIDAVERLVRYRRDLVTLLRNFVTLSDFYSRKQKAIFQAGTLYLDQRSCDLVLRVADMSRHTTLAPFSGCYLVYCTCERAGSEPITIAAALTGGDVDELMVTGRNGVFYDRAGHDWKATVVKIVEQPVSIRQAFWAPYHRMARFVETTIRNFAASRDKTIDARAQESLVGSAAIVPTPSPAPTPLATAATSSPVMPFDIAKFAGVFAAIGLAIGAIGAALTAAVTGLFSLPGWQLPLVLLVMLLLVSAPSMLLAWMTLRRRSLGPLLDANGWAVNARAKINIPFGRALTGVATLPAGASRSMHDPYAERKRPWKAWLVLGFVAAAVVILWRDGAFADLLSSL